MPQLDAFVGVASLVIVVCSVLLVEKAFHHLHYIVHDTPFDAMLQSIEKELMIVGTMAFMFKIILNIAKMPHMWVLALEFADMLVPIVSFVVCAIGILLIVMSLKTMKIWIRSYHLHQYELLEEFYNWGHSRWNAGNMSKIPLLEINSRMEFRIMHSIFCENYNIHRNAFAFDEYVYHIFEKLLLSILHIDNWKWGLIIVFFVLDYVRHVLGLDIHQCVRDHGPSRRLAAGGDGVDPEYADGCASESSLDNFTIANFALFILCLVTAFMSRVYELRIMETRGISNADDYALYLISYEEAHRHEQNHAPGSDRKKLQEGDLKIAVEKAKATSLGYSRIGGGIGKHGGHQGEKGIHANELHGHSGPSCGFITSFLSTIKSCVKKICTSEPKVAPIDEHDLEFNRKIAANASAKLKEKEKKEEIAGNQKAGKNGLLAVSASAKMLRRVRINKLTKVAEIDKYVDEQLGTLKAREDFSHIFFLSSPALYFFTVEVLIMPIALCMGLWVTNYATIALNVTGNRGLLWELAQIVPIILSVICFMYCVKCAALLQSVTTFDNDAMLENIEQTEETRVLGISMRNRMLERLQTMGDPEAQLKNLFDEIDDNGSNLLSREEFQLFLEALGISFSRRKWSRIFVEIDLNNDDEISFKELFLFLFPDNDVAQKEEMRRLKIKGLDAKKAAENMAEVWEKRGGKSGVSRSETAKDVHKKLFSDISLEDLESPKENRPDSPISVPLLPVAE